MNIKKILSDHLDSIKGSIVELGKEKIGKVLFGGVYERAIPETGIGKKLAANMVKAIDAKLKAETISAEEYYKKLENIRDRYLSRGSVEWWKYTAKIGEYEGKVLEEHAKAVTAAYEELANSAASDINNLATEAEKTFESILNQKEQFAKKLSDYGGLYSKGTITLKNSGPGMQLINGSWIDQQDIVLDYVKFADFEKQVKVLEAYRDALVSIKERGNVPLEIFDAIRELSVEDGLKVANALLKMPEGEFKKYVDGYVTKKRLEYEIANEIFNDDIENAKTYYRETADDLLEELSKSFEKVPESFIDGGIDSAQAFGEGFLQSIDGIIDSIKIELAQKLGEINGQISVEYGKPNVYNSSYNFYGSGQTVSQQLEAARLADTVNRLRG